jgi:hypothetical protein
MVATYDSPLRAWQRPQVFWAFLGVLAPATLLVQGVERLLTYLLIATGLSFLMTLLFILSNESVITAIGVNALFNPTSRWLSGLLGSAPIRDKPSPELILNLSG